MTAYRDAMAQLSAKHPGDTEAASFYARRWRPRPRRTDKTYADQLKAGAMLEKLFAQHPDHPGLAHYIIHAYDVPALAPRAVEAARRLRARSRPQHRTRCTCRRTPSRASAIGRSRSTRTYVGGRGPQEGNSRRRAARERLPRCMLPADSARTDAAKGARQLPSILPADQSVGVRRSGRRRRPAPTRWPRSRRATRSSAAPGPTPRSSKCVPRRRRSPMRSPGSRARSARRDRKMRRLLRAPQKASISCRRLPSASRRRTNLTGPSRSTFSVSAPRHGWRWRRDSTIVR